MKYCAEKVLAGIWIAVAFFLTVVLCLGISGRFLWKSLVHTNRYNFVFDMDKELVTIEPLGKTEMHSYTFKKNQFSSIESDLNVETISFNVWEKDEIQVEVVSDIPEPYRPKIYIDDDSLEIMQESNFRLENKKKVQCEITVMVPKTMDFKEFEVETNRGDINADGILSRDMKLKCTSGDIFMTGCRAQNINVKSTSGNVKIDSCDVDFIKSKNTSGGFDFNGSCPRADIDSVSGSIKFATLSPLSGSSNFETVSGSIKITVPKNSSFSVDYKTVSGKLYDALTNSTFTGKGQYNYNNCGANLNIETVSGRVDILYTD